MDATPGTAKGVSSQQRSNSTAHRRADWDRVAHVYGQCIDAAGDDENPYLPPVLPGFLAEVLARVSANYYGAEDQFVLDALEIFSEQSVIPGNRGKLKQHYQDPRFLRLPAYQPAQKGQRRRPTPFEAVVETARRLRDLNTLEIALQAVTVAALIGGSTSYGRFYNVVGANAGKPSDIDLLIVIDSYSNLPSFCSALSSVSAVSDNSLADLSSRAATFLSEGISQQFDPVLFSGKVNLWHTDSDPIFDGSDLDAHYDLSIHVASRTVMEGMILREAPRISLSELGPTRMISDFSGSLPSRQDHQRSFGGRNLRLDLEATPIGGSFVRSSHLFYIDDRDRFYPGMFQNLVLPQFDVRWGARELRRNVEAFRWKMVERLRYERQVRPHDYLRLSLAHTRSEVFAPHIIRSVDGSTLLS
jgi:hypothetical protein